VAQLSLQLVNTGLSSTPESFLFLGDSWFRSGELSFPAILVQHLQGSLLIDTGLGPDIDAQFQEEMPWLVDADADALEDPIGNKLKPAVP
jgi:N-acyl homoserine lactone hydrolase